MTKRVCIFCGAKTGNSIEIVNQVKLLCDLLIDAEFDLVYGGGKTGLMGIIANRFLEKERKVIGIRPKKLIQDEDGHMGLTELIIVDSMSERKVKMVELGDIFIALAGGIGTLDEIIETFTLYKIGFINKLSAILNTSNFYAGLEQLLNNMVDKNFLRKEEKSKLVIASDPRELVRQLGIVNPDDFREREIDKLALIEIKDGKILITKSYGKDKYYLPGGKREKGESDSEALIREISEEMSVNILRDSMEYVGIFKAQADGKKEGINVVMTCYKAKYENVPKPSNEIEEIRWLNYNDIELVAEVDKKIFKYLKLKGELE